MHVQSSCPVWFRWVYPTRQFCLNYINNLYHFLRCQNMLLMKNCLYLAVIYLADKSLQNKIVLDFESENIVKRTLINIYLLFLSGWVGKKGNLKLCFYVCTFFPRHFKLFDLVKVNLKTALMRLDFFQRAPFCMLPFNCYD
jgi:hypothetical protein